MPVWQSQIILFDFSKFPVMIYSWLEQRGMRLLIKNDLRVAENLIYTAYNDINHGVTTEIDEMRIAAAYAANVVVYSSWAINDTVAHQYWQNQLDAIDTAIQAGSQPFEHWILDN